MPWPVSAYQRPLKTACINLSTSSVGPNNTGRFAFKKKIEVYAVIIRVAAAWNCNVWFDDGGNAWNATGPTSINSDFDSAASTFDGTSYQVLNMISMSGAASNAGVVNFPEPVVTQNVYIKTSSLNTSVAVTIIYR